MTGIYKIENLINHHIYIGQSINIEKRWKQEKQNAFNSNSKSYNYPLSRAFRKYGIENFDFLIIEECLSTELNTKEKYWINYYNSFFNGYNQTLGGDSPYSQKPKENILGIIKDLETTNLYHKEIAKKWNVSTELVQGINTGRYWFFENKQYPLQNQHKVNSQHIIKNEVQKIKYYCQDCGKEIASKKGKLCVSCAARKTRKVERPSRQELFEYLTSIKGNFLEAGRYYGVTDNAIRKWCKSYEIPFHSKDYKK